MGILKWIEEHPYISGGLVLGVIILFFILSSSNSSASASTATTDASGLTPAQDASLQALQLQSATQLQGAQIQAQTQANSDSAAVAAAQVQANAQTTAAQLAAQVALQNIVSSGQVQMQTNDTTLQAVQAQIGGQVMINQQNTQGSVDVAGIQAQTLQQQYSDAVQSQQIISDAQTQQAQITANTLASIYQFAQGQNQVNPPSQGSGGNGGSYPISSAPPVAPNSSFTPLPPSPPARSGVASYTNPNSVFASSGTSPIFDQFNGVPPAGGAQPVGPVVGGPVSYTPQPSPPVTPSLPRGSGGGVAKTRGVVSSLFGG